MIDKKNDTFFDVIKIPPTRTVYLYISINYMKKNKVKMYTIMRI